MGRHGHNIRLRLLLWPVALEPPRPLSPRSHSSWAVAEPLSVFCLSLLEPPQHTYDLPDVVKPPSSSRHLPSSASSPQQHHEPATTTSPSPVLLRAVARQITRDMCVGSFLMER